MELWDAYDAKLNKIDGMTLIRGEDAPDGVFHLHRSIYVDYLCETDADKNSVVLQEGETSEFKWVTAEELRSMTRDELATQRMLNFIEELK